MNLFDFSDVRIPAMSVKTLNSSLTGVVVTAATELATVLVPGVQYELYSSVDAWFRIIAPGGTAAVVEADDNHPLKAAIPRLIAAIGPRTKVSIIRATADGKATISEVANVIG